MLKKNVGSADRVIRLLLAVGLIVLAFAVPSLGLWKWVAVAAALILAGTAAMTSCPIYSVLGLSTCPVKRG